MIIDPDVIHNALHVAEGHRLTLLDGDTDNALPGVNVRLGEGHTLGQQFATIDADKGPYVVSGDLCLRLQT